MRLIVLDPLRTGDRRLAHLLASAYNLTELRPDQVPRRADADAFAAWVDDGGFPDGTLFRHHYNRTLPFATALAATASVVVLLRDPYTAFLAAYAAAQVQPTPTGTQSPEAFLAGKALDHPDVDAYLAGPFGRHLGKAAEWVNAEEAVVVRLEDLERDPAAVLRDLSLTLGPISPEVVERAVATDQSRVRPRRTSTHIDTLGDALVRVIAARHANLVAALGYSVRYPEGEGPPINPDLVVPPLDSRQFRYARGDGDDGFQRIGEAVVSRFVDLADLGPDESVLDVGCGVGRIALALTGYLGPNARYEGFDVDRIGITWCLDNITVRFPNFRFQVADVFSARYNPNGQWRAAEYRFPYADDSFDFVFLTSVVTHLVATDTERYLTEVARVLRPGGRCYVTWFLLNDETRADIERGAASRTFPHDRGSYRLQNAEVPERAVAYDERYVRDLYARVGLQIAEPVSYRGWSRTKTPSQETQDIVVARKTEPRAE